jgi:KDO2-lipid IV(A) lauroyltransferase
MPLNPSHRKEFAVFGPSWIVRLLIITPLSILYAVLRRVVPLLDDVPAIRFVLVLTWPVMIMLRGQRKINIRRFFEPRGWTPQQCRALEKRYLRHNAQLIVESIRLLQLTPGEVRKSVILHGEEHLASALQRGRGALLVGNHVGNWLYSVAMLSACGYDVSAVAYEIPIGSIERHMQQLWGRFNLNIINVGYGASAAAGQAFRRNQLFLVLMDVSLRTGRGKWLRLGDAAINVDAGPAKLAFLGEAPILHLANHRQADSRLVITISPEIKRESFTGEHREMELTQYWLDLLKDEILTWPDQWWLMSLVPLRRPKDVLPSSTTSTRSVTVEAI